MTSKSAVDIDAFAKLIYGEEQAVDTIGLTGGDEPSSEPRTEVTKVYDTGDSNVETYKPHITRPTMSKFEFVRVCTAAAKYLYSLPDLSAYIKTPEVNDLINPAELAFLLITSGKLNATLDRLGYEKVTMSELRINPIWIDIVKNYFNRRHKAEHRELLVPYGLISADDQ